MLAPDAAAQATVEIVEVSGEVLIVHPPSHTVFYPYLTMPGSLASTRARSALRCLRGGMACLAVFRVAGPV